MSKLYKCLTKHFGTNPAIYPIIEQVYEIYQRANLHLAIEELVKSTGSEVELHGIVSAEDYTLVSLAKISQPKLSKWIQQGPIEYVDEPISNDARLSCVKRGLFLFRYNDQPVALLLTEKPHRSTLVYVELMAATKQVAELLGHHLAKLVRYGTVLRGQVISPLRDCYGNTTIKFHDLPTVERSQVILPDEVLKRIERQTIGFSENSKRLAAAGRHLKRGILLHGPPGTGKTFTAMYLASRMPGRTVILLTGAGLGSIEIACKMARILEPSTVVLEDVDLIGAQRETQMVDANALLFELLNQMDGLANDADILFVLTTNRPEVLEQALAARPGRVDQAIEVPLPDADCRRRLFALYSEGLKLEVKRLDDVIKKIEGVSAAFIRELLRKAAVFAAIEMPEEIIVRDKHIQEALADLLVEGGLLTQSLLGAKAN
jgi:cell division protease FtsH